MCCLYGGVEIWKQIDDLAANPHIVIATPGRLLSLIESGHLSLDYVQMVVYDEADELLFNSFEAAMGMISTYIPTGAQVIMVSATFDFYRQNIAHPYLLPSYAHLKIVRVVFVFLVFLLLCVRKSHM